MKTMMYLSNILLILLVSSCVSMKTSEQIAEEHQVKKEQEQKEETSKILADIMIKNKAMEDQLNKIQGHFEEMNHNKKAETFTQDELDELRAALDRQQKEMEELKGKLKSQSKFIKQITKTLNTITKSLE